jgi:uncharacterized protein YpmB
MNALGCKQDFNYVARSLKVHVTLLLMMVGLGIIQLAFLLTLPEALPNAAGQFSQQQISLITGVYCTTIMLLSLSAAWLYRRCQVQLGIAHAALDKLGNMAHVQQFKRDEALEQYAQLVGALSDVSARMENIVRDVEPRAAGMACERSEDCIGELRGGVLDILRNGSAQSGICNRSLVEGLTMNKALRAFKLWQKFLALGLIAAIVCAIPLHKVIEYRQSEIAVAEAEDQGTDPVRETVHLMRLIQQHRAATYAQIISHPGTDSQERQSLMGQVLVQMDEVAKQADTFGYADAASSLMSLRSDWGRPDFAGVSPDRAAH